MNKIIIFKKSYLISLFLLLFIIIGTVIIPFFLKIKKRRERKGERGERETKRPARSLKEAHLS